MSFTIIKTHICFADIIKSFHEGFSNLNTSIHNENESNNLDSIEISDEENIEQDDRNNSQSSEILKEHSNMNDFNEIEKHDISRMENILLSKYEKNLNELKENKSLVRDDCILVKQFEELHESLTSNVFINNEKEYAPENQHLLQNDCYEKEKSINNESNCPTMQEKIEIISVLKEIGFQTYSETGTYGNFLCCFYYCIFIIFRIRSTNIRWSFYTKKEK